MRSRGPLCIYSRVTRVTGLVRLLPPFHPDDRALQDYSEALRLNPKFAGAMRNRGNVYARKRDDDRAIRDYSEAARLDPDDPHALIGRGLVYCEKQEFDRAVRDFDAALRICPTRPRAVSGRAAAYVGKECRWCSARKSLDRSVARAVRGGSKSQRLTRTDPGGRSDNGGLCHCPL